MQKLIRKTKRFRAYKFLKLAIAKKAPGKTVTSEMRDLANTIWHKVTRNPEEVSTLTDHFTRETGALGKGIFYDGDEFVIEERGVAVGEVGARLARNGKR